MKRPVFKMVAALFVALLLTACAHSPIYLAKTWKSPDIAAKKFSKILIVGASNNLERRMLFEDLMTEEFKRNGIAAVSSYLVTNAGDVLSKAHLKDAALLSGADSVLITRLVDIREITEIIPGYEDLVLVPVTAYPLPDVDDLSSDTGINFVQKITREPPATITDLMVSLETRLFDVRTTTMVWYGITISGVVDDLKEATTSFAGEIKMALKKDGLI